jgi:hypothetical protein
VFIFNEGQKKLTEAELEKLVEADMTEWARIKSSKKADDWVSYLRTFPNGRFAEIAQMRLTRLLADVEKQRVETQQLDTAKAEKLAAEKRQQEEQRKLEDQKRREQERVEQEKIRVAAEQRLAAERKQLEEQQAQEQRRREEEQKAIEARRRQEQERLDKERQRIAEAARQAEERRKQEEQRQLAEHKRLALEAERRQKETQKIEQEQKRLSELKRLEEEHKERDRIRLAEAQRLAAERKQFEEQQAAEARRRQDEQQTAESKRRREQELLDKERQRIAEAERQTAERKKQEEQRLAAEEEKRRDQEKLAVVAKPAPIPVTASTPSVSSAPSPAAKPTLTAAPAGAPMIDIRAGVPVPTLIAPSDNPFSAGRYPLGRIFTVGDEFTTVQIDILTGVEESTRTGRVTRVDYDEDRVEFNNGVVITDLMGNAIKFGPAEYDTPVQFTPAEFQVGKKWTSAFRMVQNGVRSDAYYDLQIVKREFVTVPAGTFDTFRIEGLGWNNSLGSKLEVKFWLVPGINFQIKSENMARNKMGRYFRTERRELVAMRQQTIDTKCALPTGGLKRTLTIKSNCAA